MRRRLARARSKGNRLRRRRTRRGAAVVEFALVAPILLLLVVGTVEVGRAIMVKDTITVASREGARVAGNSAITSIPAVQSAVDNYLAGAGISGATTTVSPSSLSGVADGQPVTVTVSVPYSQVSWVPSPWFLAGQTMTAKSVMVRQPSP
jgi:Flp pilus assembly protein TadG